jgi:hypothetical protein
MKVDVQGNLYCARLQRCLFNDNGDHVGTMLEEI